jgi:hypothetical protein
VKGIRNRESPVNIRYRDLPDFNTWQVFFHVIPRRMLIGQMGR